MSEITIKIKKSKPDSWWCAVYPDGSEDSKFSKKFTDELKAFFKWANKSKYAVCDILNPSLLIDRPFASGIERMKWDFKLIDGYVEHNCLYGELAIYIKSVASVYDIVKIRGGDECDGWDIASANEVIDAYNDECE